MKAYTLGAGDSLAVVSLSSGLLGEEAVNLHRERGCKRLKAYGFKVKFMKHALKGSAYIKEHPEDRAEDLKQAWCDPEVRGVLCAIGGEDTYLTLPYLMEDESFLQAVREDPKIFLGFSDSTVNHFMFNALGLKTFYGQAFLTELGELSAEMLPYSRAFFEAIFVRGELSNIPPAYPSYYERTSFAASEADTARIILEGSVGYEVIHGSGVFTGEILGGCIETLYEMVEGSRNEEQAALVERYKLLPSLDEWSEKILLLETSESKTPPESLKQMLKCLKRKGILEAVKGVLVGKPQDDAYYEEYKEVYQEVFADVDTSVVYNLNVGHALPRAIVPFGVPVQVDGPAQRIQVLEPILKRGTPGHLDFYRFQTQVALDLGAFQKDYLKFSQERIQRMLERVEPKGTRALELGAGVGVEAICLNQSGYEVSAIDFAKEAYEASLKHQVQYHSQVNFIQGDFYQADLGGLYDLIYYLDGFGIGSDSDQLVLLTRIREHLLPLGQAYIEVYHPSFWQQVAGVSFNLGDHLKRTYGYQESRQAFTDTWTDTEQGQQETQVLACYTPEAFEELCAQAGLKVEAIYPGGAMNYDTWVYEEEVPLDQCMTYAAVIRPL